MTLEGDIETIISKKAQVQLDDYSNTPMHLAAMDGDLDIVQAEVELGYGVNRRNHLGWTPLMMAARKGHLPVVQLLLDKRADGTQTNSFGASVFEMAIASGNLGIVRMLLQHLLCGGVSRQSMESVVSPMSIAMLFNHEHILSFLLGSSFSSNISTPDTGLTPLMFAAIAENQKLFHMLIANGVDIRSRNVNGQTAEQLRMIKERRYLPATVQTNQPPPQNAPTFQLHNMAPNSAPLPLQYHHAPPQQHLLTPDCHYQQQHYVHHQMQMQNANGVIVISPQPIFEPIQYCRRSSNILESPYPYPGTPITPIPFFSSQVFFPVDFEPVFSPVLHPVRVAHGQREDMSPYFATN